MKKTKKSFVISTTVNRNTDTTVFCGTQSFGNFITAVAEINVYHFLDIHPGSQSVHSDFKCQRGRKVLTQINAI